MHNVVIWCLGLFALSMMMVLMTSQSKQDKELIAQTQKRHAERLVRYDEWKKQCAGKVLVVNHAHVCFSESAILNVME